MARATKRRKPLPRATKRAAVPSRATKRAKSAKRTTTAKAKRRPATPKARAAAPLVRAVHAALFRPLSTRPSRRRHRAVRAKRLIAAVAVIALAVPAILFQQTRAEASVSSTEMRFGMDIGSIQAQTKAGAKPDYATTWVGPWTLQSGWAGVDGSIEKAVAADVTPVIQFYYWGDDISIDCVENGCWSNIHQVRKDRATWDRLATGLATSINAHANGKPVVIILETEFNKGNIQTNDRFDGLLADKAKFFHNKVPEAEVVLGFGNWNPEHWKTFDRAAAASDYVGIQAMRGSTRDTLATYREVVDATLKAVKLLSDTFDRPVFLTDLALSSYPEATYEKHQAAVLSTFFARLPEYQEAGLRGVIYRSWTDSANANTQNYFGEAERHWGLNHASGGDAKPAANVWIKGVKASRALDADA